MKKSQNKKERFLYDLAMYKIVIGWRVIGKVLVRPGINLDDELAYDLLESGNIHKLYHSSGFKEFLIKRFKYHGIR